VSPVTFRDHDGFSQFHEVNRRRDKQVLGESEPRIPGRKSNKFAVLRESHEPGAANVRHIGKAFALGTKAPTMCAVRPFAVSAPDPSVI